MDLQKSGRIIFMLLTALSATAAVSRPWWSDFTPRAYCSTPGEVKCSSDCSQVQMCLGNPDGEYDPVVMLTCNLDSGMKCSADKKMCVPTEQSECHTAEDTFMCNGDGSFPDPYDCKKYHVCLEIGEQAVTGSCPGTDTAYNPYTADCTLTTSDRVCTEGPVKPCSELLEVGIVPENQAIYYVCKPSETGLDPVMYRCPHGLVFDVTLFSCVESSAAPTPTPSTQSPPVTPSEGSKCSTPPEVVADPEDCHGYYHCVDEIWHHGRCIDGLYYDPQEAKCVSGSCQARKEIRKYF